MCPWTKHPAVHGEYEMMKINCSSTYFSPSERSVVHSIAKIGTLLRRLPRDELLVGESLVTNVECFTLSLCCSELPPSLAWCSASVLIQSSKISATNSRGHVRVNAARNKSIAVQLKQRETNTVSGTSSFDKLGKDLKVRTHATVLTSRLVGASNSIALSCARLCSLALQERLGSNSYKYCESSYLARINAFNIANASITLALRGAWSYLLAIRIVARTAISTKMIRSKGVAGSLALSICQASAAQPSASLVCQATRRITTCEVLNTH